MHEAARSFEAEPKTVRGARRFLVEMLEAWCLEGYDFGAPLVVTELATNVVLHAGTPYEVRLQFEAPVLVVEVHDASVSMPQRRSYGPEAATGRGLNLVSSLCDDWGATRNESGKVVWASVRADDEATMPDLFDLGEGPDALQAPSTSDTRSSARSFANLGGRPVWAA